jgi:SAM-dependent methyltransferase
MPNITIYDRIGKRLVCYQKGTHALFWDALFLTNRNHIEIDWAKNYSFYINMVKRYMPNRNSLLLDGGCGPGGLVYSLYHSGYDVIGIDIAAETVKYLNATYPELDIRLADVRSLPFPDNHFNGIWSMGVIEHLREGYQTALKEMSRVLKPNGYIFLSIPYMSPLRKLKAFLHLYDSVMVGNPDETFYQYILALKNVKDDLKILGLEIVSCKHMDGLTGFKNEVKPLLPLLKRLELYRGKSLLIRIPRLLLDKLLLTFAAHGEFMVIRKV